MWGLFGGAAEPEKPAEPEAVIEEKPAEPEPVIEEKAAEPEPVIEEDLEDLGMIGNAWRTTTNGVSYGLTKTKDGFVYVSVGAISAVGDGFCWVGDTASSVYDSSANFVANNACGYTTPKDKDA